MRGSPHETMKPIRALFLGAPGSGKGTQTSRVLRDFKAQIPAALSSGDLLRQNIDNNTELGQEVKAIIAKGELVPDNTMVSLVVQELKSRDWLSAKSSWILDGFPRTESQASQLDKVLNTHNSPLNLVVQLKVPESVILDRIENRWVHLPSGRVYNLTFNPPKSPGVDDITGEPLSKRADDNPQRLQKYHEQTMPLLEYYNEQGILKTFEGDTSDIIYPKLKAFLENFKGA